jgi:hypothetical protein
MPRWKHRPEGSNWGDFGEDDQIGRMNLLTPERRLGGVAEVREGLAFTLSLPLDYPGWAEGAMGRVPPVLSVRQVAGTDVFNYPFVEMVPGSRDLVCDDAVTLSTQYSTQWDSLAHWGRLFDADGDGVDEPIYYNGFRAGSDLVGPANGAPPRALKLGIENLAEAGVQGRGVLVDLHTGHETGGRSVGYDDRLLAMNRKPDAEELQKHAISLNGHDPELLRWIDRSGVVAICSDHPAVETVAFGDDCCAHGQSFLPLHELCLVRLGIHLGEMWRLGPLARWLRAHDRSAFLITAPPLNLPGSVGSPLTPIATV